MPRRLKQLFNRLSDKRETPTLDEQYLAALVDGRAAVNSGDFVLAEPLLLKAINGFQSLPLHVDRSYNLITAQHTLAMVYNTQSRFQDAEAILRPALKGAEAAREIFGRNEEEVIETQHNLCVVLQAQGRWEEAAEIAGRTTSLSSKFKGEMHPDTLVRVHICGSLKEKGGNLQEAEPLYRRALAGLEREDVLGLMDPRTLNAMYSVGMICLRQGRYAEAEGYLRRVLDGREKVLGADDNLTIATVMNLANCLSKLAQEQTGKKDEEECEKQDQAQGRGRLGKDKSAEAETLYRCAIDRLEKTLRGGSGETLNVIDNMAIVFRDSKRYDEADRIFQCLLSAKEMVLEKDDEAIFTTVSRMGSLYVLMGRFDDAEKMFNRASERHERVLGKDHAATAEVVNMLGEVKQLKSQGEMQKDTPQAPS
ncbi:hypothetical protein AJ78_04838 [Emergomyces pasteurianus Ep9510]|uniref:MalT-like TPR region domain-containing protein n=1 Tax=Emergomyces pasteurianus Ep9510 TaxID=1447872 RepID=A0A1J9PFY0_9EURO|nr:hypothetical protein AJ78_04838 [Emergomyces pasteurianus Ep9510]